MVESSMASLRACDERICLIEFAMTNETASKYADFVVLRGRLAMIVEPEKGSQQLVCLSRY